MATLQRIMPGLWFDNEAEPAAHSYVSIFPNSRIKTVAHYGEAGFEHHRRPAGSVMVVIFELDGQ
jgi:predicted 3-demethylubiquinone-9 3-methyltransferase (glyoxalase superfamily)